MKIYRSLIALLIVLILAASCSMRLSPRRQWKRLLKNVRPYVVAPDSPDAPAREKFFRRAPRPLRRERPERKRLFPRPWEKPKPDAR